MKNFVAGILFELVVLARTRACDRCEEEMSEGETCGRLAYQRWCLDCIEYVKEHPDGQTA